LSVKVAGVENVHFRFGNVLTIAFWFDRDRTISSGDRLNAPKAPNPIKFDTATQAEFNNDVDCAIHPRKK